jgi:hypothetical protein
MFHNSLMPSTGRSPRRLADHLLSAFHHACDAEEYEIAARLLRLLESVIEQRQPQQKPERRRGLESLVAAHERLWTLRHTTAASSSFVI